MHKKKKKLRVLPFIIILPLLLAAAAAAVYYIRLPKTDPAADISPVLSALVAQNRKSVGGDILSNAASAELRCRLCGEAETDYRRATQTLEISYLDIDALTADMGAEMQQRLNIYVENAFDPSDVYDSDGNYLTKVVDNAYSSVLMERLQNSFDYVKTQQLTVELVYDDEHWRIADDSELVARLSIDLGEKPGYAAACAELQRVPFHYILDDWTSPGPIPDKQCYGETDDPSFITGLFDRPEVRHLTQGQQSAWREDAAFIPDSMIKFYLDETIFAITWQEETQGAVGTYSEVFIGDGSQLRRKLAGDIFACYEFYLPSVLSVQSNAVVAVSGDMYDVPDTVHGTFAYNGKARWVNLYEGQTCFFTAAGDMLFAYEGQFNTEAAVQRFIDDNHIMFSASYGPVLIENGVDVTPDYYILGDINGRYARCAIGQLGPLHYLMMTANAVEPYYGEYFTLRQVTRAMAEKGCIQAYALAGGHNATIVMDNRTANPVQYGYEKYMSDIIYFATALER